MYGLPEGVRFCKRCVISNQRPNSCVEFENSGQKKVGIHFDEEGICDACRVAERKERIDWWEREEELRTFLGNYLLEYRRRKPTAPYDCVVPGSGGKDSFYAAHRLKFDFGMHPLTVTWAPHLYTDWGRRNHDRWIAAGFDNILVTPNTKVHRLLTRLAVENLLHPFQPFVLGQKNLAPKIASLMDIPLVFYGENEAEYGNPKGDCANSARSKDFFAGNASFLGGVGVEELKSKHSLTDSDLSPYLPVSRETNVDVRYLGYYLKWHPQSCYYYAVEHGGFEASPERTPGTYSKYNSIDDKIDDFHYYCTYIKFGIGRATYDASQEIRSGDITRDEALYLVRKFDGEFPDRFAEEIFDYLNVPGFKKLDKTGFLDLCEKFKPSHLWDGDNLKHKVWEC